MACCVVTSYVIAMMNKGKVVFLSKRMIMHIRKKDIDKNEIEKLCFIIIIEMESNRYEKLSSIDQRHFKKITYKQIVTKKDYG